MSYHDDTLNRDLPTRAKIEGNNLVIRIGIDTLAHAAENCNCFYDPERHTGPPYTKVADKTTLARDGVTGQSHFQWRNASER